MNTIIDLASRAVSFINLIQDVYLSEDKGAADTKQKIFQAICSKYKDPHYIDKTIRATHKATNDEQVSIFEKRAIELVWISRQKANKQKAVAYTAKVSAELASWINTNREEPSLRYIRICTGIPTPFAWRTALSEMLYNNPDKRIELAQVLQYLPVQVVIAAGGGKYHAHEQRILQLWNSGTEDRDALLDEKEQAFFDKAYDEENIYLSKQQAVKEWLRSDIELKDQLLIQKAPLSFELVFNEELAQIKACRVLRNKELQRELVFEEDENASAYAKSNGRTIANNNGDLRKDPDPYEKAKEMKLFALTMSGGGIRSATFNLGILQGMAEKGMLNKIDYLSTVSGGGYIGSWIATWIKRIGSVNKVSDRLNADKSPDPFAEEVRPVRWLRMYSNYLSPRSGIMSLDAWTIGITWLRNTFLNMIVILFSLLTVLLLGRLLFIGWQQIDWSKYIIYGIWGGLMLLVSFVAGFGMRAYASRTKQANFAKNIESITSLCIAIAAIIGAYFISAWFHANSNWDEKFNALLIPGGITVASLLIVAFFGKYHRCIDDYESRRNGADSTAKSPSSKAIRILFFSALVSGLIGMAASLCVWLAVQSIMGFYFITPYQFDGIHEKLIFSLAIPLLLIAFGASIVARMALLGKYFPDERREWWGRLGGVVNRLAFLWLLVSLSALLGQDFLNSWAMNATNYKYPTVFGAWVALIASAVKLAFSAKTTGGESKGFTSVLFNSLSTVAPYLFILGLLVFVPGLMEPMITLGKIILNFLVSKADIIWSRLLDKSFLPADFNLRIDGDDSPFVLLFLIVTLGGIAYWLACRLGVNEFSMHHFYRNRLVRAYLGATRRSAERSKTANSFTQFDRNDDEKLSSFTVKNGYSGPYPIINTALNASQDAELDRQDRQAESFIFSPLYCGFDFSMTRASASANGKAYDYGFRPTGKYAYPDGGPGIGTAMAISGAAVNPNEGYHSSPATAFLLTVFNVRLGWWIGNPRRCEWQSADPYNGLIYLMYDLVGKTNTKKEFVCLSDGGHFDNMGLYEMVRRRCSFIIVGDGEQDEKFTCEGLANAIRRCQIDFGAEITIDISAIVERDSKQLSKKQFAIGTIKYQNEPKEATLLYLKSSITGEESVDVREYAIKNPAFPHQTTGDQFFNEDQFESYRKLGLHIFNEALKDEKVVKKIKIQLGNETGFINHTSLLQTSKKLFYRFIKSLNKIREIQS